jgi:hypothetical protein
MKYIFIFIALLIPVSVFAQTPNEADTLYRLIVDPQTGDVQLIPVEPSQEEVTAVPISVEIPDAAEVVEIEEVMEEEVVDDAPRLLTLEEIDSRASFYAKGDFAAIREFVEVPMSTTEEKADEEKYLSQLYESLPVKDGVPRDFAKQFITYGSDVNTVKLGKGERAAVINSYVQAYGKFPETQGEIRDVLRIANGRFPATTNPQAELRARLVFQKIYDRVPNTNNANDNAAVAILTYGLKQQAVNRNLSSERSAIAIFRRIFNQDPVSTEEWNMVQTIAYSGAVKKTDQDGDGLSDEDELFYGTDMFREDTDGDGFGDGVEVLHGYSPIIKSTTL